MTRLSLLLCLLAWSAWAAERTIVGEYEINFYRNGKDYRTDAPNFGFVAGPYESRETCKQELRFVKVRESGVWLRCDPVEQERVR